jgi:hypothetical protein
MLGDLLFAFDLRFNVGDGQDHERWRFLMAAIDDLNAAVASLQAEETAVASTVDDLLAEVTNLTNAAAAGDSAAIEAAVANITSVASGLKTLAVSDPGPQETATTTTAAPAPPPGPGETTPEPTTTAAPVETEPTTTEAPAPVPPGGGPVA